MDYIMKLKGKSVLVTGADGFIGSHLVEQLLAEGCAVRALSYYNSFNNWGWLESLSCLKDIEVVSGDVRDAHLCEEITKGIDVVFHLAALIAIPYSYRAPDSYIDTNIKGTSNICLAALKNGCEKVIHTSTSEVYGTAQYVPIDEKHPLQAQSPYSASKIGAESMALSYANSFELSLTIARPFNTYGPRQSARAIIPSIISQIASGKEVIEVGDLAPTRDLNYVKDTCRGFLMLAECDAAIGKTVNIGSGSEISMQNVLDTIKKKMNSSVEFVIDPKRVRPKNSEVMRLVCDNSLIKELTGFSSEYGIESGIEQTVKWFGNPDNLALYKADIYNV